VADLLFVRQGLGRGELVDEAGEVVDVEDGLDGGAASQLA
jgi:hypothetical protein